MQIEYRRNGDVVIAAIEGRLAGEAPAQLRREFPLHLEEVHDMVVDCHQIEYMDSSGLGALLSCLRIAVGKGGDIRLAAVPRKIHLLLELTRAERVFQTFVNVNDAVASFANQESR